MEGNMAKEKITNLDMTQRILNLEKEVQELKDTIICLSNTIKLMQKNIVSERNEFNDFDWEKTAGG